MIPDVAPLEIARQVLGLTFAELWHSYFALGGDCSVAQITSHLGGAAHLSSADHDMLVHALNEVFHDRDMNHPLVYSRP